MRLIRILIVLLVLGVLVSAAAMPASASPNFAPPQPKFSEAVAFDVSPALRDSAAHAQPQAASPQAAEKEIRPERGPDVTDNGFSGDGALRDAGTMLAPMTAPAATIPAPLVNFEGLSSRDNFNAYGFRVNPPDPDGDVGLNHYVEIVNLTFAVYDKTGHRLLGPVPIGDLWKNFAVNDCTDPSGDPIALYDQFQDRWLLSQFTTRGPEYFNCVAISQTGDPTGAYFRYAFSAGLFFPDYPKYGVWKDMYVLTSRDFGPTVEYGISVYALEKNKMMNGDPKARSVKFFLDSAVVPISLMGDGLLPPDIDGKQMPKNDDPAPVVGTQNKLARYGATFDALNIWELDVHWRSTPTASFALKTQLPVADFDSIFPCNPNPPVTNSRDCLPQPGIVDPRQYLDILSYRQRPTWRLAYRNFKDYDTMVTNQSVEARPGIAGVRWYEIRRQNGVYTLHQQGTYAPNDGVHRWMGSIAMDGSGNIALGYSVVNGTNVYPGIRYTGRLNGDPLGQMTLGEGTIIDGSGVQRTTNSRWGDYTSMNIDPVDDCTFWYVNEYYTLAGQQSALSGWQTRIAAFKLPGCKPLD